MKRTASAPLLLAALLTAGCAADGPFPSLAVREAEQVYAAGDPLQTTPEAPDRAGLAGRIAAFLAAANEGEAAFQRALAAAQPLAARSGERGSESWIAAQQAISRVEAARAATTRALGDLDQFSAEQARQGPLSTADFARLTEATARLQAQADRQRDAVARLR
jgi:hypothetical protein